MKIVVLAGGCSPERDVSLSSGSLIANALMKTGHSVLLLDLYEGTEIPDNNLGSLFSNNKEYQYKILEREPDLESLKKNNNNEGSLIGKNVLEICKYADIVFMALHGGIGENGQMQAIFDAIRN